MRTADMAIMFCRGSQAQIYTLEAGLTDIAIDPTEAEFISKDGLTLQISGTSAWTLRFSPRFGRVEITRLTTDDVKLFFNLLFSDPDVLSVMDAFDQAVNAIVNDLKNNVDNVLSKLPKEGETARVFKQIDNADWEKIIAEIRTAVTTAVVTKSKAALDGIDFSKP